jgi:ABC-2 type transport system permease protein
MTGPLKNKDIRVRSWLQFFYAVSLIVLAAGAASLIRFRIDLSEDKRYTLSVPTRKILSSLGDDIYIQVFLDGDIPIPLKKLKRSVSELLEEFRLASGRKIDYEFINPSAAVNSKDREKQYVTLSGKGLIPVDLRASDAEGGSSEKRIFPGMIVNYNGIEVPVNFLKNNPSLSTDQNILHSVEGLEYEIIETISTLTSDTVYRVAFIEGHKEIPEIETADITMHLAKFFTIDRGAIAGIPGVLDKYAAVIIAGPEEEFSESDKLVLDQYIMNGGKVMWFIDEVAVNSDSLAFGQTFGIYRPLNIEDQLFRYGARVNPYIVKDLECNVIRLKTARGGSQQFISLPWVYDPMLVPSADHSVTRNINRVKGAFVNYIDTVGLDGKIKKKILLSTSVYAKKVAPPLLISLKEAEAVPDEKEYNNSSLPVAVLLEGVFPSAFRNRSVNLGNKKFMDKSIPTRMIVVADADIIRNEVKRNGPEAMPLQLGQDKYTGEIYGNRDFIVNSLNWLVDDNGLMDLRSRELKLRLLDRTKIKSAKTSWQLLNLFAPVLIVALGGFLYTFFRKRKYTA